MLLIGMTLIIAIPGFLTMATIKDAPSAESPDTPYGYTVSLTLFLIPALTIGVWHLFHPGHIVHRRALTRSALAITVMGFLLDIGFGYHFFVFPNRGATLGIRIPAWDFNSMAFTPEGYLPIEEFGFYLLGSLFVLAVYIWADLNWLPDYQPDEYAQLAGKHPKLIRMSTGAAIAWPLLVVAGFVYKRYAAPVYNDDFPGYFIFIMVLGFLPTFLFLRGISPFVNWRAFGFTFAILLLISLMWEATLGVPYGWWDYQHEQMLGITFKAWANLPLEAVLLWLVIAWDCVIAYELFRIFGHMEEEHGRPRAFHDRAALARRAFFGAPEAPSDEAR